MDRSDRYRWKRVSSRWAGLVALVAGVAAHAAPPQRVRVELLTMGPGSKFFTAFGHAALRVRGPEVDVVYNFGYTDFTDPALGLRFVHGEAVFWADETSFARTLQQYRLADRTVYRQALALTPGQHRRLATLLADTATGRSSRYQYHHYFDNCATRLRDAIDKVVGGAVHTQLEGRTTGRTFRQLTREGFARSLPLLLFTDYLLGRAVDREVDWWQAGFLPDLLSRGLRRVRIHGQPLAGPPMVLYRRGDPLPTGNPFAAVEVIALGAIVLTLLAALAAYAYRKGRRVAGLLLLPVALTLGLLGVLPWIAVSLISLPELRLNELALILWPTDLLLLWLAGRWLRGRYSPRGWLRSYLLVHLVAVAVALIGHGVGLLIQRPLGWLAVAGLPLAALNLALWWPPRSPEPGPTLQHGCYP